MTDDATTRLGYAPAPPLHRRPRLRRWALFAGFTLLLVVALWLVPRTYRHVQLLRWQSHCLAYAATASEVVYDNDPAEAKRLLALPRTYLKDPRDGAAYRVPIEWIQFYLAAGFGPQSTGTLFLHQRTSPSGRPVLLALDLNFNPLSADRVMSMGERVIVPGALLRPPRQVASRQRGDGTQIRIGQGSRVRVFAGQPDANNPSHFTIDYEMDGARHKLDGWLEDDQSVRIELRE
ncbi:MAG: hypothetical protein M3478_15760 [Planctomycetota bacterium]|nr:hypothetical protein [Planctomycetota bacterium]